MKATFEELLTFVAVVKNGSFHSAANQLSQANSTVSRAIKKLEGKLGITLLNRTTRQLSLTQEGENYFYQVQKILNELDNAENILIESQQQPQGLLRIDAATPVLLHLLTPLIEEFHRQYPAIILALDSSETFINLIERKVDIAIRVGELSDSTLKARKLRDSHRRLVASPDYLEKFGTPNSAEELMQHCCIGFSDQPNLNHWPLLQHNGKILEITPTITTNSGETQRHLCLHNNGIACLSDFMIDDDIKTKKLIQILADKTLPVTLPIHAVYYSDSIVSSRIRCFIDYISKCLNNS